MVTESKGAHEHKGKIKKFIQKAHLKRGSYRESVWNRFGRSGFDSEGRIKQSVINRDKKSKNMKTKKRAILAETLQNLPKSKRSIPKVRSFRVERNIGHGRSANLYTNFKLEGIYPNKRIATERQNHIKNKFSNSKLKVHTRHIKYKEGYAVYIYRAKS